jgi:glycosyltransferase involved in cell wall biosynthesis
MMPLANYLRLWDYASAARVDEFVANSANVQRRIWKTYRRESEVIYPPVDVTSFYHREAEDYYLIVSELVAYKRVDAAVREFTRSGRRLLIVGDGPEYRRLRPMAGPTVEFAGRVEDAELRELYARCRAFLLPGEEDFGIATVEALASGKPVIALGRGGALETAPEWGGIFYDEVDGLGGAVEKFEKLEVRPRELQAWAARFSTERFMERMGTLLWAERPRPLSSAAQRALSYSGTRPDLRAI